MRKERIFGWILIFIIISLFPTSWAWADGGYFSKSQEMVAVSADQRAIIIKNGNVISMTFSTGYTGEGEDFGWIIPTPVPPAIEDVWEAGKSGERAFELLDAHTAPVITTIQKHEGCFPFGTKVLTAGGSRAIETVEAGTEVYACDLATGEWVLTKVFKRLSHQYEGDMITIRMGWITIQATGNHPFYVLKGDRLVSRPLPQDIPKEDQAMTKHGRWVEARDLREGDVLKDKGDEGVIITAISSRQVKTEVYNLEVEGFYNYAVHQQGILVHNKSGKGREEDVLEPLVTVYARVTLEHYEVSILGAADASALLGWLQENGYQVNPEAEDVLDTYIDRNWAFVAVKLNPGERRHYENEFLPPLTIGYKYDELIFPLHISSVSTTETAKITLYVIAESTVTSYNLPSATLIFEEYHFEPVVFKEYIETCIQRTISNEGGRGLIVMWSGMLDPNDDWDIKVIIDRLMKIPFLEGNEMYLTRLETRMGPESMTEDIRFMLDSEPGEFQVNIHDSESARSTLLVAAQQGEIDMVQKLLQAGANANMGAALAQTALMGAAGGGHAEIVSLLLESGAKVDARNNSGYTALINAAFGGDTETVKLLLDAGADVEVKFVDDRTALMIAVSCGHTKIVKILLEAGANVNAKEFDGTTSLMNAARSGDIEIVKILLEAGAEKNTRDKKGWTASMYARSEGHSEILKLLRQARRK